MSKINNNADNQDKGLKVNDYVLFSNGEIGIIKFIGKTDFSSNPVDWYGIEYIDGTLSKHDGTVKGKKYFNGEKKRCCFVRGSRIRRKISNYIPKQIQLKQFKIKTFKETSKFELKTSKPYKANPIISESKSEIIERRKQLSMKFELNKIKQNELQIAKQKTRLLRMQRDNKIAKRRNSISVININKIQQNNKTQQNEEPLKKSSKHRRSSSAYNIKTNEKNNIILNKKICTLKNEISIQEIFSPNYDNYKENVEQDKELTNEQNLGSICGKLNLNSINQTRQ